jgi:transposase
VAWTVAIGVDTHRDVHVAVALDGLGRRLGSLVFSVDGEGFAQIVAFARSCGEPAFVVEGTGSYGASLARALLAEGFAVFECERPQRRRRKDKNDLIDAELAARRLLTGEPLPLPRTGVEREQVRLLLVERRSAQHAGSARISVYPTGSSGGVVTIAA